MSATAAAGARDSQNQNKQNYLIEGTAAEEGSSNPFEDQKEEKVQTDQMGTEMQEVAKKTSARERLSLS